MCRSYRFGFIGVTASASSINAVFPRWAELLRLGDVRFEPLDVPLDAPPEVYRRIVTDIRTDPDHRGALVTSHKVRLFDAARACFDGLDQHAALLGEVSCISKRDDRLLGHAKDPETSGAALDAFLPKHHFARTGAHVLCFGAGGSGSAIAVNLLTRPDAADRPRRVVLVDRDAERLAACRDVFARLGATERVELISSDDPRRNDDLVDALPEGALIANATGMGKDVPGSPVTDAARFPGGAFVWELNYRGNLTFLEQARRQARRRRLHVEDGWNYFVYGWSAVVAEAFDRNIDAHVLQRLSAAASEVRG